MQDEVNEKTIALYIKTGKLTAQTLQKAMKAILSKGKKQLAKPPQGKQSLKQLMKQNAGVSNIEITEGNRVLLIGLIFVTAISPQAPPLFPLCPLGMRSPSRLRGVLSG